MAWQASWLGSWVSNWLGNVTTATSDVTVNVAATVISVFNTTAVGSSDIEADAVFDVVAIATTPVAVVGGARSIGTFDYVTLYNTNAIVDLPVIIDTTACVVTLYLPAQVITTGAQTHPTPSIVTLYNSLAIVQASSITGATFDTVTIYDTAVLAYGGATGVAVHNILTLVSTDTGAIGGAVVDTTFDPVNVLVGDAFVTGGSLAIVIPVDIFLESVDVKVYDYNDIYQRIEADVIKAYSPEILAFSTDITTDMEVVDAMETDMESIDGTQQVKLLRKTDNVVIDMVTGQATPENKIYTFNIALIRQISDRDNRAVKQLRQFMQSVQNDDFYTMDTIIELPMRDDVQIHSGDIIQSDLLGTKYTVIAVDTCTLKTRWRIGARRLV